MADIEIEQELKMHCYCFSEHRIQKLGLPGQVIADGFVTFYIRYDNQYWLVAAEIILEKKIANSNL